MSQKKKLIIISAPTGGNAVDREGTHVPTTPDEIAEEAFRSREAGAAVIHIHARDPKTKVVTSDLAVFSEIITKIRERCDVLISDDDRHGDETKRFKQYVVASIARRTPRSPIGQAPSRSGDYTARKLGSVAAEGYVSEQSDLPKPPGISHS